MGGADVSAGESILNQANIPTFAFPDSAARTFFYMWRYQKRLQSLYETPYEPANTPEDEARHAEISRMIDQIRRSGRTILTEYESKKVLAAYNIPTVDTRLARSAEEAIEVAAAIGYPVVLKLNSESITHKTDVGGVRLDLATGDEVRHAFETMKRTVSEKYGSEDFLGVTVQPMLNLKEGYELIIGSSPDPQFGPVLLFGSGGTLVEVFKDRALGLPPLTTTLARRMMERTTIYKALQGVRGREAVDLAGLEELLVHFGDLVIEQKWIKEIDINPFFASADDLIALDARVVLYAPEVAEEELPRLAIRPYPTQYVKPFITKKGDTVLIRPIRPEDEPKVVEYHKGISEKSVYLRYFRALQYDQRVEHERLVRICHVDYDREVVLVAERTDEESGESKILGIGRLTRAGKSSTAEYAILISDAYQGHGLGTELLRRLLEYGRAEGITRIEAYILAENRGMLHVSEKLGFSFSREGETVKAVIDL